MKRYGNRRNKKEVGRRKPGPYKLELDNGEQHEIDVYLRDDGTHYRTTGDGDEAKRAEIIRAFNELY